MDALMNRFSGTALLLATFLTSSASAQLSRPVACDDCIANWFYFDNDGGADGSQDWSCASSSYNGHKGTDLSLRGGLAAIDTGHDVVAAADGVVERSQDGFFDRCTRCSGDSCGTSFGFGYGNHVVIRHGERRVVYAHLRTGSVSVAEGDTVSCGQSIGQIGSSGCTTGAHVHVEVRPPTGGSARAFDPYEGACSPIASSAWNQQGPHRGLPGNTCGPIQPQCPPNTFAIWTCTDAATERVRCIEGEVMTEACPAGCVSMPVGTDDVCGEPPTECPFSDTFICEGRDRVRCMNGEVIRELCPQGCRTTSEGAECRTEPVDADLDGHNTSVDCDDSNPSVFPGAIDQCGDGLDANCDGRDECDGQSDASLNDALPDGGDSDLEGGCDCKVTQQAEQQSSSLLWLMLGAIVLRRRSKRHT